MDHQTKAQVSEDQLQEEIQQPSPGQKAEHEQPSQTNPQIPDKQDSSQHHNNQPPHTDQQSKKRTIAQVEDNEDGNDGKQANTRTRLPDHRPVPAGPAPTQQPARCRSSYKRDVLITNEEEWIEKIVEYKKDAPIKTLRFDAAFQLNDRHVEVLLQQGNWLRLLQQLEIGGIDTRLPLTDHGFSRLISACPKAFNIQVSGAVHLTEKSFRAAIHACPDVFTIAICGADFEPNAITGAALREIALVDRAVRDGTPAPVLPGREDGEHGRLAPKLVRVGLKNTSVDPANVRLLRDERPRLRIADAPY